ncbi:MAG TPA: cupin domain-containing protein [Cellulomonas sp.]
MQIVTWDLAPLDGAPGVRMAEVLDAVGIGRARVHLADLDAGSCLPRHPAGLDQTFVVLTGSGRVAGEDDVPVPVGPGDVVRWRVGEQHTSWADGPMRVLIVQHGG